MSISDSSVIYKNKEVLEHEISELNSMISEFEQVLQVLKRLPNKVQHEIMVPLGPLAFSSGYIINTNKVLMHLGSDLYAERTTFESQKTINRRLSQAKDCFETMKKNLSKIEEALKLKDEFSVNKDSYLKIEAEIKEEMTQGDEFIKNITFKDGTAEIREEISEDVDISKNLIPPPLSSAMNQKPYIPDSHVEEQDSKLGEEYNEDNMETHIESVLEKKDNNELDILETEISNLNILKEPKVFNDKGKPISIFKQRMAAKK
ncbi:prefoldin like molecular chaperone [Cryptosporidium ubiquitum]|uniref:Prefoldin like molecular chaperone n=1 Tax=Cryptosporidium ubiquitum TaxID=857276 RepID=A0A1J4MGH7_9CRYT|nr:prefoldin like molecular chaperone [Cryptosporidium ubiquitum]OII72563.1 prefoldin like molecular chaperone [Cryptosporidium ubiquitum]